MNTSASNKDKPKAGKDTGFVASETLLGSRRQLVILHDGQRYTLRITVNNKLILTK